jgi:MFS family permease
VLLLLLQVVSSLLAGAAVGSLGGSGLADSLGRKTTLLLDAAPLLAGAVLAATAGSLSALVLGRVLSGVGIGLASALVPLYISEVRPLLGRGKSKSSASSHPGIPSRLHSEAIFVGSSAACSPALASAWPVPWSPPGGGEFSERSLFKCYHDSKCLVGGVTGLQVALLTL